MGLNYSYWYPIAQKRARDFGQTAPRVSAMQWANRDKILKRSGFTQPERFWLCQHTLNTPAMKAMIQDRRLYSRAMRKAGFAKGEYEQNIYRDYYKNHAVFRDGRINPFAMLAIYREGLGLEGTPRKKLHNAKKDFRQARKDTLG